MELLSDDKITLISIYRVSKLEINIFLIIRWMLENEAIRSFKQGIKNITMKISPITNTKKFSQFLENF